VIRVGEDEGVRPLDGYNTFILYRMVAVRHYAEASGDGEIRILLGTPGEVI
jgi:hypothetical protein